MDIRERKLQAVGMELMDYMECVRQELNVPTFFNSQDARYLAEKLVATEEQVEMDDMQRYMELNVSTSPNVR